MSDAVIQPPGKEARLKERELPKSKPVMRQSWRQLLFLHWAAPGDELARQIPPSISLDLFDGKAWVGIVPFFMRNVRPTWSPALPWISNFLELNVRTYVYDREGRPGVWFFSLDCNQPAAVEIARKFFHLNYRHASMKAWTSGDKVSYCSRVRGQLPETQVDFEYTPHGDVHTAEPGTLEFFLLERYRLFAADPRGRLHTGSVHHAPYEYSSAEVSVPDWEPIVQLAGCGIAPRLPDHTCYCKGVDVTIYPAARSPDAC